MTIKRKKIMILDIPINMICILDVQQEKSFMPSYALNIGLYI